MNKRQYMLLCMLKEDHQADLDGLTQTFEVSARTLRNDVQYLNGMIRGVKAIRINSDQVAIDSNESFFQLMSRIENQNDCYQYKLSAEERRAIAALILLYSDGYTTVSHIAQALSVSTSTMVNEIKILKEDFAAHGLTLRAKTKLGFEVVGTEEALRSFIFELCPSNDHSYSKAYNALVEQELTGKIARREVRNSLSLWERKHDLELTDSSFTELSNYLVIICNRLLGNHQLSPAHPESGHSYYPLAVDLLHCLCDALHIAGNETEATNLANVLMGCRYIRSWSGAVTQQAPFGMQISAFISEVYQSLHIEHQLTFKKYCSIFSHIDSTLRSIENGYEQVKNPLCGELQEAYPRVFEATQKYIPSLEKLVGQPISLDTISFIAMHIIAVLEEVRVIGKPLRAVLVCSAGMCTAILLQSKLLQHFDIEIEEILSLHNLPSYDLSKVDIIISTVPVGQHAKPSVCISPLLNENDIEQLHRTIQNEPVSFHLHESMRNEQQKKIGHYIDRYQQLLDQTKILPEAQRRARIEQFYTQYFGIPHTNEGEPYLHQLLTPARIALNVEAADWRSAMKASGALLLEQGDVEPSYIEHMIANVEDCGPYIVCTPHVAIAHSSAEHGSNRFGISFIRLQAPVPFSHADNDPVHIVVSVAVGRGKEHLFPVFQLLKLFQDANMLRFLLCAEHPEQIIDSIRLFELHRGEVERPTNQSKSLF